MNSKGNIKKDNSQIAFLIDGFLKVRSTTSVLIETHLDEDSLNAFIEGQLSKVESQPIINHLVGCSFCRQVTAELVKLELSFAETDPVVSQHSEPTKVSEVINGLFSRLFGNTTGEVFAHQEPEDEKEDKKDENN